VTKKSTTYFQLLVTGLYFRVIPVWAWFPQTESLGIIEQLKQVFFTG